MGSANRDRPPPPTAEQAGMLLDKSQEFPRNPPSTTLLITPSKYQLGTSLASFVGPRISIPERRMSRVLGLPSLISSADRHSHRLSRGKRLIPWECSRSHPIEDKDHVPRWYQLLSILGSSGMQQAAGPDNGAHWASVISQQWGGDAATVIQR